MSRETHQLESRYFERMAASLGDKMKIIEALPPVTATHAPRVLDVGAGGGEFSHALEEFGYTVVALDASDDAIMRMREKFPELTTVKMLANEAANLGENSFDAIVCSSILHEVYSYGDNQHKKGELESLKVALQALKIVLKPGGTLVIRDGVKPDAWQEPASVRVIDGSGAEPVLQYLEQCPFSNGFIQGHTGRSIQLARMDDGWFAGTLHSAYEFYMTYNWGVENYPREAQELYGVLTLEGYCDLLQLCGFTVESAESWIQEGYVKNLPTKVELLTEQGHNCWSHTNALWVARCPKP